MPRIIVMADRPSDIVMLSERISVAHLESEQFRAHLLERLSWAVGDAHAAEQVHQDERSLAASPKDRADATSLGAHAAEDSVILQSALQRPASRARHPEVYEGPRSGIPSPRSRSDDQQLWRRQRDASAASVRTVAVDA